MPPRLPIQPIHRGAVRVARFLVWALLAVSIVLGLGLAAVIAAPQGATARLTDMPYVAGTLFGFLMLTPMLAGIPVAWGLLALGRRVWRRHRILAWPAGAVVFSVFMDVLPARTWQNSIPLGDRVPGVLDATLLERMGDMFWPALAGGLVAATLWWLLLGDGSPPPVTTGATRPDPC